MPFLEMIKAVRWDEARARTSGDSGDCSEKVKEVKRWRRRGVGWSRGARVRTYCPVLNIDQGTKKLLCEESSMICLMEIDAVSREDAC